MPQTTIKYTISSDGKRIKETVEGVTGKACKQITKPIEDSLGDVIAYTPTTDYYQQAGENLEYLEDHDWHNYHSVLNTKEHLENLEEHDWI